MTPAEWFDQFPVPPVEREHPQWCERHWAPCPQLGANGLGAALELVQAFVSGQQGGLHYEELNRRLAAAGKLCCALGDEKMYELWGRWGPHPRPSGSETLREHPRITGPRQDPRHDGRTGGGGSPLPGL